jgi:hypothetical protein
MAPGPFAGAVNGSAMHGLTCPRPLPSSKSWRWVGRRVTPDRQRRLRYQPNIRKMGQYGELGRGLTVKLEKLIERWLQDRDADKN